MLSVLLARVTLKKMKFCTGHFAVPGRDVAGTSNTVSQALHLWALLSQVTTCYTSSLNMRSE